MLEWSYYGNTLQTWLTALVMAVTVYLFLTIIRRYALVRLEQLARRTPTQLDNMITDVLGKTTFWFTLYLAVYAGAQPLSLTPETELVLGRILVVVMALQVGIWGNHLVARWLVEYLRRKHEGDPGMQTMVGALGFLSRLVLFSALFLMAMQNMGVKIDALLAGLGIGGIAVALSVQNVLGDLFASLSIVFDKPFLVGDFIILDNGMMGTVQHVGLKTTRIRSLTGEELVVANNDLLRTRIRNYRTMEERMVSFTVRVVYQTPHEKLQRIPQIIRGIVDEHPRTAFEWANFVGFGTYSLDFDVAYYVKNYEWYSFMKVREEIYLEIVRQFHLEGIQLAYPTQSLFVQEDQSKQ